MGWGEERYNYATGQMEPVTAPLPPLAPTAPEPVASFAPPPDPAMSLPPLPSGPRAMASGPVAPPREASTIDARRTLVAANDLSVGGLGAVAPRVLTNDGDPLAGGIPEASAATAPGGRAPRPEELVSGAPGAPQPGMGGAPPVLPQFTRGSPGQRVAAQWMPGGRTTQVEMGTPQDPEAMKARERARELQEDAISETMRADVRERDLMVQQRNVEAANAAREAEAAAARQRAYQVAREDADRRVREASDVRAEVDKNAFTRIGAALAMAIGSYAATITGGQNTAMMVINDAIERDVAAKKQKLQERKEWRGELERRNLSEEAWHAEESARRKQAVQSNIRRAVESQTMEQRQSANALGMMSQLEDSRAADLDRIARESADRVVVSSSEQYQPERVVGGSGPRLANAAEMYADQVRRRMDQGESRADAEKNAEKDIRAAGGSKQDVAYGSMGLTMSGDLPAGGGGGAPRTTEERKAASEERARYVPEAGGYARTPEDARKLRAAAEARANLERNYNRIRELRASLGNRVSPSAKGELDAIVADNTIQWKNLGELGVLSADDRELIAPLTGQGALDLWSPAADARIDTAMRITENRWRNAVSQGGVTPGTEAMTREGVRGRETAAPRTPAQQRELDAAFTPSGGGR